MGVGQLLTVQPEMVISKLRPYLVLWSNSQHRVYFVELAVPWEDVVEKAFKWKKLHYTDLAAMVEWRGWTSTVNSAEVLMPRLCGSISCEADEGLGNHRTCPKPFYQGTLQACRAKKLVSLAKQLRPGSRSPI